MAGNPNPQHNPTDGLGVAAYVTVLGSDSTGSAITKVGSQVALSPGNRVGGNQYACTLSVGGLTPPFDYESSTQLSVLVVDVKGNTYSADNTPTYKSYNDPAAGSPSWYRPSNGTSGGITGNTSYNANVASVSSTGLITALHPGQAIIEVQFPTFDFVASSVDPEPVQNFGNPVMMIYAQIIVTVVA